MLKFERGMPTETDRFTVLDVARKVTGQMIPLNANFSFFCTTPIVDEDLRQYVHEPLSALPPELSKVLPHVGLLLVPFLEESPGRAPALVSYDQPEASRSLDAAEVLDGEQSTIALATSGIDMSEYHYTLYDALALQIVQRAPKTLMKDFSDLLHEEVEGETHGEIREESWTAKQKYINRAAGNGKREAALWKAYLQQALRDTLTLYLHGICCDIDVEAGPRQLASRFIRKRLELLQAAFPPPEGYAVFPEQVHKRK
jgi:hypothetical protein